MIEGKTLLFLNADGQTQTRCAGSTGAEGCTEIATVSENAKVLSIPYICRRCWLKGWRSRGENAYAPGEAC